MQGKILHPRRLYLLALVSVSLCTSLLILIQSQRPELPGTNASYVSAQSQGDWFSVDSPEADSSARARRLPHAIIIGTRKSGTRALLRFLEVNRNIRSASSEIHFFDRSENYNKGLEWYRDQMPATGGNEITIEKSPAYFVTRRVPELVRAMNASVKLIVIFRDPVTRLISDYSQLIANKLDSENNGHRGNTLNLTGREASKADQAWKKAALEFEKHVLTPDGRVDEQRRLVRTGMYSLHLEKWLAVFPRGQIHFVDGERLISEPHAELQRLERFLGVSPIIKREHFVYSPQKGFYCLKGSSLPTTSSTKLDRSQSAKPICLSKSKGRRHVVVNDDLRRKLADFYAPFNEYLSTLTNISLN